MSHDWKIGHGWWNYLLVSFSFCSSKIFSFQLFSFQLIICVISFWIQYNWIINISYFFPCSIIFLKLRRRKRRHYLKTKQKTKNLKKSLALYMCFRISLKLYNSYHYLLWITFREWPLGNKKLLKLKPYSLLRIEVWGCYHRSAKFVKIVLQKLLAICSYKESWDESPSIDYVLFTDREAMCQHFGALSLGGTFGERRLTCRFPSHHPQTENK